MVKLIKGEVIFVVSKKSLERALSMKYNQQTLHKIEKILDEGEYVVRYERGTFQSGYCILEAKKVVVLNKFLSVEGRINTLIDLVPQLNINLDLLTHESQKLFDELKKKATALALEAAEKDASQKAAQEKDAALETVPLEVKDELTNEDQS
jgi:hypothetical protein